MASRSPTVGTPLLKSSVAPETPLKDAPTAPQIVPFPPPQTFEIIPPLHGILLRLLSPKDSSAGTSGAPGNPTGASAEPSLAQNQQPSSSVPDGLNNGSTTASQAVPEVSLLDSSSHPPLDVKNLPTETSSVRIRIQKARAVVEGLPDVHRSVDEQRREIWELEDRVSRLRSVISDFGTRAGIVEA
ncbi:uncharacterized protein N7529_008807 [Penicillium soppii]|jgi:hypothetical protein|uniref:uncharacterized protein n=1 Tax=Penicillium soppii TaxID=69789 RepID=UPI002548DF9B|nr:uncharacterized protein N7529_008807 [Penicillium soppii]KAJ5861497.1 hypothetical protein N7529_008807 [Penicillium soppii]